MHISAGGIQVSSVSDFYPSRHPSLQAETYFTSSSTLFPSIISLMLPPSPLPCFVSPLVGARGSGPPLICSQNKQAGKHHETFRGGRAVFSLIHTGNPEMHSNSCSQCSPFRAGLHLRSSYIYSVRIRSLNGTSIGGWNLCTSVYFLFFFFSETEYLRELFNSTRMTLFAQWNLLLCSRISLHFCRLGCQHVWVTKTSNADAPLHWQRSILHRATKVSF